MNSLPESEEMFDSIEPDRETGDIDPTETTVCVVGLGYVGLPLAVGFDGAGYDVVGYDVSAETVSALSDGSDTTGDLGDEAVEGSEVAFTTDPATLSRAEYVLVTVPTPVDENNMPSMEYVVDAGETIGRHVSRGTTVVLESTVYPGATREVLVPAIERSSGFAHPDDFSVGYSPERSNPGDEEHGLSNVVKIVSGETEAVREEVASLYGHVIDAGVHRAPSMEVAEAAKVIENVQRDLNIALVNELAMAFDAMGIDTRAVLDAAGTKWNFHEYEPGLVGGHCIPVDPYFLAYAARREGYTTELVHAGRTVNESVSDHVADLALKALSEAERPLGDSRLLLLGLTYKADVSDIRSSKVDGIVDRLEEFGVEVVGFDPRASDERVREEFGIETLADLSFDGFDAALVATPHREFRDLEPADVADELNDPPVLVDVDGTFDRSDVPERVVYRRV